jgi:hypothetical protein
MHYLRIIKHSQLPHSITSGWLHDQTDLSSYSPQWPLDRQTIVNPSWSQKWRPSNKNPPLPRTKPRSSAPQPGYKILCECVITWRRTSLNYRSKFTRFYWQLPFAIWYVGAKFSHAGFVSDAVRTLSFCHSCPAYEFP